MRSKLLFIITLTIIAGCTIQKRQHRPGYHIEWKKRYSASHTEKKSENLKGESAQFDRAESRQESSFTTKEESSERNAQVSVGANNIKTHNGISSSSHSNNNSHSDETEVGENAESLHAKTHPSHKTSDYSNQLISQKEKGTQNGDNSVYLASLAILLATAFGYKTSKRRLRKLTRWASKNTKKAEYLIAGVQIPLMGMSVYAGYNFYKTGYDVSNTPALISATVLGMGIAALPFLPKRNEIVLPKQLNRRRMSFLAGTISSCILLFTFGNNVGHYEDDSYSKQTLEFVDQAIFGANETPSNSIDNDVQFGQKFSSVESSRKSQREAASFGMCVLAVLLYILLIVSLCAGICIAVIGIGGAGSAGAAIGLFLLGMAIAVGSVLAMIAIAKSGWCR